MLLEPYVRFHILVKLGVTEWPPTHLTYDMFS